MARHRPQGQAAAVGTERRTILRDNRMKASTDYSAISIQ